MKVRIAWCIWLVALGIGGECAAQFGTRGAWYVGLSIGAVVGMATWFRRPRVRQDKHSETISEAKDCPICDLYRS